MTTDLPALPVRKQPYGALGFGHKTDHAGLFNPAMAVHVDDDPGNMLPSVQSNPSKRRTSEGQVLQVKFAPDVTPGTLPMTSATPLSAPTLERVKTVVPGFDTVFNVDHTHYEQWARVPGRRGPSSTLLRGIQALKARMKRESMEQERVEAGCSQSRELHINTLTRNSLLTRDRLTEEHHQSNQSNNQNQHNQTRRDKFVSPGFPKAPTEPRNPLKMTTIEAEFLRHGPNGIYREEKLLATEEHKQSDSTPRDFKPRIGISKIRDRCAIPVSVYQPITIGDHVFLINEPIRYNEFIKLKSRNESRMKKDAKSATGSKLHAKDAGIEMAGKEADDYVEQLERSKTFTSGFQTGKSGGGKRAPASVSSAEVFDFSQLSEIRHSLDGKLLERSKTEFAFNTKGARSVKLVPNVRRLKEVFKSME